MIEFGKVQEEAIVDAIERGKIVRVSESYARREGLLILRKTAQIPSAPLTLQQKRDEIIRRNKGLIAMDDLRKPLKPQNNEILKELADNFHWILVKKRRDKLLSRKKVADAVGESEDNIKMIENGVLPMNNFVLINKLESYYGINLRKDKPVDAGGKALRQVIEFAKKEVKEDKSEEKKTEEKGKENNVLDLSSDAEIDISRL